MDEVAVWLKKLGLGKYATVFAENEVDFKVLPQLTEEDIRELGLPLGPRRKLLTAIAELASDSDNNNLSKLSPLTTSESPSASQAERRQLTVMFIDLVGSTALSERLDPEELSEIIRRYQDCCAGIISRFEGYIAKFMGDGILVYFGYPQAHEDDAERAVRAGLDMVQAVSQLQTNDARVLQARIGIATGLVVVGELIGRDDAQERTVVGETPNLAARLQALAHPGQVVIAEASRQLLGKLFKLTDLGPQTIKGLSVPVHAYAVQGVQVLESRFQARQTSVLGKMVGREYELDLLHDRWQQAKAGDDQLVLLEGEAGIGKSRIVRALIDQLAAEDHFRINYQCSPYHTDSALYPVVQQLIRAANFAPSDDNETKLNKLEALLVVAHIESSESAPLIAALLRLDVDGRYGKLALNPQQQRRQTLQALVDQLLGLARRWPVLLVLEDVHWIDPSTLELIELTLAALSRSRVLLLLTARPSFEHAFGGHPRITRITLNRLGRNSALAIINRLSKNKTLPAGLLAEIIDKTDGVPLFIEELTKTLLDSGLLREADSAYVLDAPLRSIDVPTSLHDSLMARLDRLPSAKQVAQLGAALGRVFSYELLAALTPLDEARLQRALAQLMSAELVFRQGTPPLATYTFKHALVQDVAYESLLFSKRRELHIHIAETLEQRFPQTVNSEPERLARHYTEADFKDKAIAYWQSAGEQALQRSANQEAIHHLSAGQALLDKLSDTSENTHRKLDFQMALCPALMATKGWANPEVEHAYTRARKLCQQIGGNRQLFHVLRGLFYVYFVRADQRAQELAENLLQLAEQQQDTVWCLFGHQSLGVTLLLRGEIAPARMCLERGIILYKPREHRSLAFQYGHDPGVLCLAYAGWALWLLGYPEQAKQRIHEALDIAKSLSHSYNLGTALALVATFQVCSRDGHAAESADAVFALGKEEGLPNILAYGAILRGRVLADQEQGVAGIAQIRQGLVSSQSIGIVFLRPYMLSLLAEVYGQVAQAEQGLEVLDDALTIVNRTEERWYEAEIHRLRGELLCAQSFDNRTEAESCFNKALDISRHQQAKSLELRAATSLARLWQSQSQGQDAHNLLSSIYHWFNEGFDTTDLKDAKALLDELE